MGTEHVPSRKTNPMHPCPKPNNVYTMFPPNRGLISPLPAIPAHHYDQPQRPNLCKAHDTYTSMRFTPPHISPGVPSHLRRQSKWFVYVAALLMELPHPVRWVESAKVESVQSETNVQHSFPNSNPENVNPANWHALLQILEDRTGPGSTRRERVRFAGSSLISSKIHYQLKAHSQF